MKISKHPHSLECTAPKNAPQFEPSELLEIALGGAANFLSDHPDISAEKQAVLQEMIAEERAQNADKLKIIMRRYKVALNQAKIFQAKNQDEDYPIFLERSDPTVDSPGFIKLSAEDLNFKDTKFLKAIAGASSVDVKTIEIEVDDGFIYQPELTFWFKI